MNNKINSITIVGGGTAGWMSAVYLHKALCSGNHDRVTVRVIESEDIGIIGVGEATVPTLAHTLQVVGIPESKFVIEADASFKQGIRFANWLTAPEEGKPGHSYFHPFEAPRGVEGFNVQAHWLRLRELGAMPTPMHQTVSVQSALCEALRSPKLLTDHQYQALLPYAYHLDAVKFAHMLRQIGIDRGVVHMVDNVTGVNLDETGNIASLVTAKSGLLAADLFIDCSGFQSLLIEKHLHEAHVSFADSLLCDAAVALQLPHQEESPRIRPYTTSSAKSAGWIWEIDLFSRRGNGYVYSSQHQSQDEATAVLLSHLGLAGSNAVPRHLKMRVGYHRRSWVRNCVAIGLSCGFIEPLESTGIFLIEYALWTLVEYIASGDAVLAAAPKFNRLMEKIYLELRDFVQMHYIFTRRGDTKFWLDYRNEMRISDALLDLLELWQYKLPSAGDFDNRQNLFGAGNYTYILAGMGHLPKFGANASPYIDPRSSERAMQLMQSAVQQALNVAPNHHDALRKIRAGAG
jgi:tryptophan halogenase